MTSRMFGHVAEQHDQPVDAEPEARRRRQPVLEGADVVLVDLRGLLVVARLRLRRLLLEAGTLVVGVGQLGEAVAQLTSRHDRLVALDELGPVAVAARQRRHLRWIVDDEHRAPQLRLGRLLVDLQQDLAGTPRRPRPRSRPRRPPSPTRPGASARRPRTPSPRRSARPSARAATASSGRARARRR